MVRTPTVVDNGEIWMIEGPLAGWVGPDGVRCGSSRLIVAKSRFFGNGFSTPANVTGDGAIEIRMSGTVVNLR